MALNASPSGHEEDDSSRGPTRSARVELFTNTVIRDLEQHKQIKLGTLCEVSDGTESYPVVFAHSEPFDSAKPTVLLTAGTHGDEPAGIEAAVRFMTREMGDFTDRFNFVALPCLNPTGFVAGKHDTEAGVNLNSLFGTQSDDARVQAIEKALGPLANSIALAIDLHEDNSWTDLQEELPPHHHAEGCYAYETVAATDTNRIARGMIDSLAPRDVCTSPEVYGEKNTNGVIDLPVEGSQPSGPLHEFLKLKGARHVLAIETPAAWPMERRIQNHVAMIRRGVELTDSTHSTIEQLRGDATKNMTSIISKDPTKKE